MPQSSELISFAHGPALLLVLVTGTPRTFKNFRHIFPTVSLSPLQFNVQLLKITDVTAFTWFMTPNCAADASADELAGYAHLGKTLEHVFSPARVSKAKAWYFYRSVGHIS